MIGVHNHAPEYDGQGAEVLACRAKWLQKLRDNPQLAPIDVILDEREEYDSNQLLDY